MAGRRSEIAHRLEIAPAESMNSLLFWDTSQVQGKYVILFIFGTALAAALFGWTFQYQRGRRILELWGADNARLIRVEASSIELLVLDLAADEEDADALLEVDGQFRRIAQRTDVTASKGIIHARQSLIEDASFVWDQPRGDCQPNWLYAMRFSHDNREATIVFDTQCQRLRLLQTGREAAIAPKIFSGWMAFLKEQEAGEPSATP